MRSKLSRRCFFMSHLTQKHYYVFPFYWSFHRCIVHLSFPRLMIVITGNEVTIVCTLSTCALDLYVSNGYPFIGMESMDG